MFKEMKKVIITVICLLGTIILMAQEEYIPNLQVETITILDTINMDNGRITNLADAIDSTDAVNLRTLSRNTSSLYSSVIRDVISIYVEDSSIVEMKDTLETIATKPDLKILEDSLSPLAYTITESDTTWWGRAETDPIYSMDSTYIVWFNDLIGIRDSLQHALDSIKIINDSLLIFSNKISTLNADTASWNSLTANDTIIKVVTPTQMYNYLDTVGIVKTVYSITLPYSTTVAGRIALAVSGVDYPTGWVISGDGLNLVVTHNLGRWVSNVTVFAKTTGTERQQLFNTAAYNGITSLSSNAVKVFSLATISKDIIIYLNFE
jgi:hypothetical protein